MAAIVIVASTNIGPSCTQAVATANIGLFCTHSPFCVLFIEFRAEYVHANYSNTNRYTIHTRAVERSRKHQQYAGEFAHFHRKSVKRDKKSLSFTVIVSWPFHRALSSYVVWFLFSILSAAIAKSFPSTRKQEEEVVQTENELGEKHMH